MKLDHIVNQPVIEAERFSLRPVRRSDLGLIQMYTSDARVAENTASIPHPLPPGSTEAFIDRVMADDRTEEYSGGMKRRLNIGVGLLHRPDLLILDEPTVGVDPQSRNAILESVERLGEEGMAVLYTTHYMEEAERLCDRIGIVDHGELIAEGSQADLVQIVGQKDRLTLVASGVLAATATALGELPTVDDAAVSDDGITVIVERAHDHLPEILTVAARAGALVKTVDVDSADLESVFLKLTGKRCY